MLFFVLFRVNEELFFTNLEKHYEPIVKMVIYTTANRLPSKMLFENLDKMNLKIMNEKELKETIVSQENMVYLREISTKAFNAIYKYKNRYYIQIITYRFNILFEIDEIEIKNNIYLLLGFLIILIINLFTYIAIIKKLTPLKKLRNEIKKFGDGELNINCATSGDDEISDVANEFDKAVKRISSFKEARNIFIRNIMHELKTPITKGKILSELIEDNKNKDKLDRVFQRLETLINEFASIEKLMITKEIERKHYFLIDILDNAIDLLMLEDINIEHNITDEKVYVNYQLFSVAIKNMIDNAIKYSIDSKIIIEVVENEIRFKNCSPEIDLTTYLKPFCKGENSKSLGLGLYIVSNILKAHHINLDYRFENEFSIFIFKPI